ncbi:hypothetical protein HanRHA438_Chr15g0709501 [Helianthus annuus]|uniref:Uncharacterized protein n=1 Tax=Helianthus annuus TaxID=4232 RepID=A0A251T339_HELAN|nr:hypothetical protein HanRHA438_Chr15g0709501 [Helianthus annuus]
MNFVVFRTGGFDKKRERKAVSEARRRPFFSTLLGFRHYVQICHFVPITRRQVIARVGFRHCVQILNYLGFRRTRFVACRLWYRSCRILYSAFPNRVWFMLKTSEVA